MNEQINEQMYALCIVVSAFNPWWRMTTSLPTSLCHYVNCNKSEQHFRVQYGLLACEHCIIEELIPLGEV